MASKGTRIAYQNELCKVINAYWERAGIKANAHVVTVGKEVKIMSNLTGREQPPRN